MNKWNQLIDPKCDCGHPKQTVHLIVNESVNRKFNGGMVELNEVTADATGLGI